MSLAPLRLGRERLRFYLRVIGGDERYRRYVERSRGSGVAPMSREQFERHRSDHRDAHPEGRCC